MNKKILLLILGGTLICFSQAYAETPMPIEKVWEGPFENSRVFKMIDQQAGVACYVYAPRSLTFKLNLGVPAYAGNSVGSISCVRLKKSK